MGVDRGVDRLDNATWGFVISKVFHRIPVIAAATALVLSACGGASPGEVGAAQPEGVPIELDEFRFVPPSVTLVAGQPTLVTLTNTGEVTHEWAVGSLRRDDGGYDNDLLADADIEVVEGHGYEIMGVVPVSGASRSAHASRSTGTEDPDTESEGHSDEGSQPEQQGDDQADQHAGESSDGHTDDGHAHDGEYAMVHVEPDGRVTLRVTLPTGAVGIWEMGCFQPGHYEAGMVGSVFVVGGPSAAASDLVRR